MSQTTMVLALLTLALDPGPLDAFRANYASIKVDIRYNYTEGVADPEIVGRLWRLKAPEYDAEPDYGERTKQRGYTKDEVAGRWGCDGTVEYFDFATPDLILSRMASKNVRGVFRATELLCGESILAGHLYKNQGTTPYIIIWDSNKPPAVRLNGTSPFLWWMLSFPDHIEHYAAGTAPKRRTAMCDGHPVEVEIYEHEPARAPGVLERIEISYDPVIGYLPRYARGVFTSKSNDEAAIAEMYLINARRCSAGGFVPTEWYATSYPVSAFSKRYPNYDDETALEPSERIQLEHFHVTDFKDLSAPLALSRLEGVKGILANGHVVAKFVQGTRSLGMDELKSLAHKHLTNPTRAPSLVNLGTASTRGIGPPSLDKAELNEYSNQSRPRWRWAIGGALLVVVIGVGAMLILRGRAMSRATVPLILCCWTSGCAQRAQPPVVSLKAAFAQSHVLLDTKAPFPPLELVVRNEGNEAIRLRAADGGCSCRKIDQSKFPALLQPKATLSLKTVVSPGIQPNWHNFVMTFETDRGRLSAAVPLLVLPIHQIDPSSFFTTLQEGQRTDWRFDLVHRTVFRVGGPKQNARLEVPPEFTMTRIGSYSEPVNQAPELQFEDTTYRITLRDNRLGTNKTTLTLRGPEGQILAEAPITWQRVPFLATSPDRITLGERPIRTFLRCPDEHVELTRVIEKPAGIRAVVSSLRELTVLLDDGAPAVINGQIVVETTAHGRPPLRIPIVRYAPTSRTAALNQ